MHENLIKRLRELQAITEHCDEQSCGECKNRELCDKYDNKTLSGTYKEAIDAIETLYAAYTESFSVIAKAFRNNPKDLVLREYMMKNACCADGTPMLVEEDE